MSKVELIQQCAKSIFEQTKAFEDVEVTFFDDGGALVEIDGTEVYLSDDGEIERTVVQL